MAGKYETRIQALADIVLADYGNERVIDRLEMFTQPDRQIIEELIGKLLRLVFPGYYRDYVYRIYNPRNNLSALIEDVAFHLNRQIAIALRGSEQVSEEALRKRPQKAAEGVILSGQQTARGRRSGEAALETVPKVQGCHAAKSLRQKDGKETGQAGYTRLVLCPAEGFIRSPAGFLFPAPTVSTLKERHRHERICICHCPDQQRCQ